MDDNGSTKVMCNGWQSYRIFPGQFAKFESIDPTEPSSCLFLCCKQSNSNRFTERWCAKRSTTVDNLLLSNRYQEFSKQSTQAKVITETTLHNVLENKTIACSMPLSIFTKIDSSSLITSTAVKLHMGDCVWYTINKNKEFSRTSHSL